MHALNQMCNLGVSRDCIIFTVVARGPVTC